jgi:diaminohydroxyphosphoribosylaminopyrimidine deaminase / 5-amino-6-(5-phosphoribosylamino)uracil reductase
MVESDNLFMRHALDLARKGAGLVSPNPLVGAVLVKGGRIVGEGYHRYDLLKHGETYAIEMAGDEARGSTLYCNLEPCCHQGRTPPCTDSLINAGIARAVIATTDPFTRINGRGIEQLRAANIGVDVGLYEDDALRLNETYFKFVTRNTPFLHGVIEYPPEEPASRERWQPSRKFVDSASEYDAIIIGSSTELNGLLIESRLSQKRHRPLAIVGPSSELDQYASLRNGGDDDPILIELSPPSSGILRDAAELQPQSNDSNITAAELDSTLESLARSRITSVLLLPGVFEPSEPKNFEQLDKLTLAVPGATGGDLTASRLAFGDLEFDLEEITVVRAAGYTEFTGYPSFRGVA